MEILFENRVTHNKEWAKDIYGHMYLKRPVMLVLHIIFLLYFIYAVYNWIVRDLIMWNVLLFFMLFFFLSIFKYFTAVKTALKRDIETHGKPMENLVIATDDEIKHQASNGAVAILHYSDIKRTVQTKKYIYLWSKAKLIYSLKKDAFSVGNAEDFLAFLKQKGIKVK